MHKEKSPVILYKLKQRQVIKMAKKYYAVRVGRETGIFDSWDACKAQTIGFKGAVFKSFQTLQEAENYVRGESSVTATPEEMSSEGAVAYVDGSYHVGTKEFSCGAVLFLNGEELHFSQKYNDPMLSEMRNVAGEIKGSETILQYCIDHNIRKSRFIMITKALQSGQRENGKPIRKAQKHTELFVHKQLQNFVSAL